MLSDTSEDDTDNDHDSPRKAPAFRPAQAPKKRPETYSMPNLCGDEEEEEDDDDEEEEQGLKGREEEEDEEESNTDEGGSGNDASGELALSQLETVRAADGLQLLFCSANRGERCCFCGEEVCFVGKAKLVRCITKKTGTQEDGQHRGLLSTKVCV